MFQPPGADNNSSNAPAPPASATAGTTAPATPGFNLPPTTPAPAAAATGASVPLVFGAAATNASSSNGVGPGGGLGATTATPAPTAATGFSFGSNTPTTTGAPPAAAPTTTAAPAPATTNLFGSVAPVAAPAGATTTTPLFGGSTTAPTPANAPAPTTTNAPAGTGAPTGAPTGTPLFGANTTTAPTAGAPAPAGPPAPPPGPTYMSVPEFHATFPGLKIYKHVQESHRLNDAEFDTVVNTLQATNGLWKQGAPNPSVRQTLQQHRTVLMPVSSSSNPNQQQQPQSKQEAHLNDALLQELFELAEDLALTEQEALALLAHAKQQQPQQTSSSSVNPAATLYWTERKAYFQTLLYLFQKRMELFNDNSKDNPTAQVCRDLLKQGLVPALIQLVQSFTTRLDTLLEQRRRHKAEAEADPSRMTDDDDNDATRQRQTRALSMQIAFGMEARQMAAELLFFVTYSFHLGANNNVSELVLLLRLIQKLSAGDENNLEISPGLRPLDPRKVPSAYTYSPHYNPPSWTHGWPPSNAAPPPQEEKNPFVWQTELVQQNWEQGHPQMLRCISTLLVAAVSAMDVRQELVDRQSGRTSVHTDDSTNQLLNEIRPVLFQEVWAAPHVLGILYSGYAVLLQSTNNPAIASTLSPRTGGPASPFHHPGVASAGGGDGGVNAEIRRTFRTSLQFPAEFKAFTFARLSVIPALQIPADNNTPMPGCRVSEFLLSVLTGLVAEYFELLLDRDPPISRAKWHKDAEEDLALRRVHQANTRTFQHSFGTKEHLEPIPASVDPTQRPDCMDDILALTYDLCRLGPDYAGWFWSKIDLEVLPQVETMVEQNGTLLPGFTDLLSSLAVSTPDLVHELLSRDPPAPSLASPTGMSVATEEGDNGVRILKRWGNVLYYCQFYNGQLVDKSGGGSGRNESSGGGPASSTTADQSTMYYYWENDDGANQSAGSSPQASSASQTRELGDDNTLVLSSHLRLIEAVASRSAEARSFLRNLSLPHENAVIGGGGQRYTLWEVLFSLTTTPLQPEVRGLVFEALASIVDGSSADEIRRAWQCIEDYGILPIYKLLVYPAPQLPDEPPCLSFPPSSTARVNEKHTQSWIPADSSYALLYEMEYIEASRGVYPATCGFLRLLLALFQAGGCPADLGRDWRSRAGCSPYMEYLCHCVLPRAVGTFGSLPSLPFRTSGDKDRMVSLGLGAVAACLQRYIIPDFSREHEPTMESSFQQTTNDAKEILSIESLVHELVVPVGEGEFQSYLNDFVDSYRVMDGGGGGNYAQTPGATSNQIMLNSTVPKTKSPGFLILSELLNRTGSPLLNVVKKLLEEGTKRQNDVDEFVSAYAVYGAAPPTISSAKAGHGYALKHLILKLGTTDHMDVDKASANWSGRSSKLLEILCSAACREKRFASMIETYRGSASVVPVVKFQKNRSAPDSRELQVSHIGPLLSQNLHSIVEFVGFLGDDLTLARAAFGFVFYLVNANQLPSPPERLVHAVSKRLVQLSAGCNGLNLETELFGVVLRRSLASLQSRGFSPLLGLPANNEGLNTIVGILDSKTFLVQAPKTAASCYELMCAAMKSHSVALTLGACDFWRRSLLNVWSLIEEVEKLWYSVGSICGGLGEELNLLASASVNGFMPLPMGESPKKYQEVTGMLLRDQKLRDIILSVPLKDQVLSESVTQGFHLLIGAFVHSSRTFGVVPELAAIMHCLLDRLGNPMVAAASQNLALAAFLVLDFQCLEGKEDPTKHIREISAVISKGGRCGIVAAGALADILCKVSGIPADVLPHDVLENSAAVLLRVSCAATNTTPAEPTSEALIARSCLKAVLPIMDENMVQRLLTEHGNYGRSSNALESWISLLSMNDEDITYMIQLLPLFSFGSDLLLEAQVLRGLEDVAKRIASHTEVLETKNLQADSIAVPKGWQGHLELMGLILLRASRNRQLEASVSILRILSHYERAAKRLFSSFPNDGDTAVAYTRCCYIAAEMAGSTQLALPTSTPQVPGIRSLSLLAIHIAENPLPRSLNSSRFPVTLQNQHIQSDLMSITAENAKSWWDSLEQSNDWGSPESNLFYFGLMSSQISRWGLVLLRENNDLIGKVDVFSIARGLCQTVDALKWLVLIEKQPQVQSMDPKVLEEHQSIKMALCDNVAELLHVAVHALKLSCGENQRSFENTTWEEVSKPLKVALDYTRLDTTGLSFSTDEAENDSTVAVAEVLRTLVSDS